MANATTEHTESTGAMQPHPLSLIFPQMPDGEFDELVASIQANGLRHPIVLYEGMVLDGRHRQRRHVAVGCT